MDAALVAAASLSMCDVSGWFLPDKAIGLVDGHARCRTESELVKENAVLALKALLEGGAAALQQKVNDDGSEKTTARLAENGKELGEKLRASRQRTRLSAWALQG